MTTKSRVISLDEYRRIAAALAGQPLDEERVPEGTHQRLYAAIVGQPAVPQPHSEVALHEQVSADNAVGQPREDRAIHESPHERLYAVLTGEPLHPLPAGAHQRLLDALQ